MFSLSTLPKTPEDQRLFGVFKGYQIGTLARNGLRKPGDCIQ